jgi:hypothetical protein
VRDLGEDGVNRAPVARPVVHPHRARQGRARRRRLPAARHARVGAVRLDR